MVNVKSNKSQLNDADKDGASSNTSPAQFKVNLLDEQSAVTQGELQNSGPDSTG